LGFDAAEARVIAMRADLMPPAENIKGGLEHSKAAKELGITNLVYRTDEKVLGGFQRDMLWVWHLEWD